MATQQTTLRLGPADAGRLVSSEDFAGAEFVEPWKYGREGGRLIVLAPSGAGHVLANNPWRDHLGAYRLVRPDVVYTVTSEAWIRVDGGTDRIADIGVYLILDRIVPEIPDRVADLVYEIVSPGKAATERDYTIKKAEYRRLGVEEYVIVVRFRRRVTVCVASPDGHIERTLTIADSYESPLLPGLVIPLGEVL